MKLENNIQLGNVKLYLDGRWDLIELSQLSRLYLQLYSFVYSLENHKDMFAEEEISYIYSKYPWIGGFSTVNFYENLYFKIPKPLRPNLKSIQYSSPGFIELNLILEVAGKISAIIATVCFAINHVNKTYRNIQKGIHQRKLSKIDIKRKEIKLTHEQTAFVKDSIANLANDLNFPNELLETLKTRTEGDLLAMLKILISFVRRLLPLAKLQNEGKLKVEKSKKEEF